MSDNGREAREERIDRSLRKCAQSVTREGPEKWDVALRNGELLAARVWLDRDWLHLAAGPGESVTMAELGQELAWSWLRRNGTLPGGAKYAIDPRGNPQIRAEMLLRPEESETDLRARLGDLCAGVQIAAEHVRESTATAIPPMAVPATVADTAPYDLRPLCEEVGWPFTARASGKLVFTLDTAGDFHQATLARGAENVRLTADLGTPARWASENARAAVALLLLTLGGVARMIRPAGEDCDGRSAVRLEAHLGPCPLAGELAHALAALSVACRLCGREVEVLRHDNEIAVAYLVSRGLSSWIHS